MIDNVFAIIDIQNVDCLNSTPNQCNSIYYCVAYLLHVNLHCVPFGRILVKVIAVCACMVIIVKESNCIDVCLVSPPSQSHTNTHSIT